MKQVGKAQAESPVLEVDRVDLKQIAEIFDQLDIGVVTTQATCERRKVVWRVSGYSSRP